MENFSSTLMTFTDIPTVDVNTRNYKLHSSAYLYEISHPLLYYVTTRIVPPGDKGNIDFSKVSVDSFCFTNIHKFMSIAKFTNNGEIYYKLFFKNSIITNQFSSKYPKLVFATLNDVKIFIDGELKNFLSKNENFEIMSNLYYNTTNAQSAVNNWISNVAPSLIKPMVETYANKLNVKITQMEEQIKMINDRIADIEQQVKFANVFVEQLN